MIRYSKTEDIWNAATHAAGILLGVGAGGAMLVRCCREGDLLSVAGMVLYLIGMLWSYAASTVYHAWPHTDVVRRERLRQSDHAAIYWHIAGSYSPVTLMTLGCTGVWGYGLFVFIWTAAIAGTVVSIRGLREHSHIETVCFCLMGLSVLVLFPVFIHCVPRAVIWWLLAEGAAYITGAVFYAISPNREYMHTVFHAFVLLGSAAHIVAVWILLNQYLS